ncbi:MAG: DUF5984 family protein [Acidobacteria bacterium]|nr:DUF5984 family protein [Acidobacteriota bacterium]
MALFEFELTPVDAVTPWGPPNAPELCWYALTDGRFWIQAESKLPLGPGVWFYAAQIWESLLDIHREEASVLNLRFLEAAPEVTFSWVGDTVRMVWDGDSYEMPQERLRQEIRDFHERFFGAMAERASRGGPRFAVDQALRYSWLE